MDSIGCAEDILDHGLLCPVQLTMLLCKLDCSGTAHCGINAVPPVAHPVNNLLFRLDSFGRRELTTWHPMTTLDGQKLSCGETGIQIAANLRKGNLAHAATEPVPDKSPLIDNRLPLEVLVTRIRQRLTRPVN